MTSGKVHQHPFIPPAAVDNLRRQASRLAALGHAKDRREWKFGELVNKTWDNLPEDVTAEVSREMFFVECSRLINEQADFPIVSASGETLRRWCEVVAAFENMPGIEIMREHLSFEHFRLARVLANKGKVSVPAYALAVAAEQRYTADEMRQHFDPPEPPDEYARATGHLEWMETFDWNGKKAQALPHVRALRELLA
ncbi:MAG: hypothetical protein EHM33_00845 [Chloroflexi bacterium]|nr:MAG: hypothetical protein EHM33_00845 [Chloroflexota bacterium]